MFVVSVIMVGQLHWLHNLLMTAKACVTFESVTLKGGLAVSVSPSKT